MKTKLGHKLVLFVLGCVVIVPWLLRAHETAAINYDFAGRLVLIDMGGGHSVQYYYDASGNLLRRLIITNTDTDGDGMDDAWEMFFFGTLARNGTGDFDGDGQSDLAEFLAGTDPTNSASVLRLTQSLVPGGGMVSVQWDAIAGRKYRLQFKSAVTGATWQDVAGDVVAGGPTATKVDAAINGITQRYYRVIMIP